MNSRISQHLTFVIVFILLIIILTHTGFCQSKDSLIWKVEKGLLPYVLIKGEPPYNLEERMKYYKVPGISIAVIKDYEIKWSKQYGVMDAEIQNLVTDATIFNVGSLSKGVASLAVLRLVQEGKVDLNENINKQLISWKLPENEFTKKGTVTPLLLMNHSGGVMFSPPYSYLPDNFPTLLQVLNGESPAQSKPVVVDKIPGTEYQYSNAGYTILQQLVVDAGKQPFPQFINEKIFKPLGMNSSTFEQPLPSNRLIEASAGHMGDGAPLAVKRYYYPGTAAGGLWTTALDYAKFIIELQKSYIGKSNKIVSQNLTKEMLSSHVAKQYGLGIFMREMNGEINYFGHFGDNRGFFAGYVSHLTDGYGTVVFTNSQSGAMLIREIIQGIARVYDWNKYLPKEYIAVDIRSEMIDSYCGRYKIGSDDFFEIEKKGNELFINRYDNARLYFVGEGKFVIKSRDGYLRFNKDLRQIDTSVVFYFSDELGRFLNEPQTCFKLRSGENIPIELIGEGNIKEANELYRSIKKDNPSDFYVSENRLNSLGYEFLAERKYLQAIAIFSLNVEFYPESANCYDSLAEAYMNSGDSGNAIINYKKSLELDPANHNAAEMIKILEGNK